MKKELDPKITTAIIVVVVLIIGALIYFKTAGPGGEQAKIINAAPNPEEFQKFMQQQPAAPAAPAAPVQGPTQ